MSCKHLLLVLLVALPVDSVAQVPELFEEITESERAQVQAANEHYIKRDAYFAKRYRIVQVNVDALLGPKDELSLVLFDGTSLRVVRQKLSLHDDGTNFVWRGRYKQIPFGLQDVLARNPEIDPTVVKHTYESVTSFEILGSQYVFDDDPANAEELAGMRQDPSTGHLLAEQDRLQDKVQAGTVVYSVFSNFSPFIPDRSASGSLSYSTTSYQLRSLPMDRRYGVLYEMDPHKQLILSDDPSTLTPQQKQKARQYQEFLDSLGEDPRSTGTKRGQGQ